MTILVQPVRVTPEAYYLFETPAAGVPELCDAFKVRHLHESQNLGGGGLGGKTPYAARTPARTPAAGHATPGRMSVRHVGRTPNPYGGGATPFGTQPPPSTSMPPPPTPAYAGYQTPSSFNSRPPGGAPGGMNPARAAMIQQSGGWSTGDRPGGGW